MEDSGIDSGDHNGDIRDQQENNILFIRAPNSDSSSAESTSLSPARTTILAPPPPAPQPIAPPTSRQLHRKLEARIENARRLHHHQQLRQQQQQPSQDSCNASSVGQQQQGRKGSLPTKAESLAQHQGQGLLPLQRLNIPRVQVQTSGAAAGGGAARDQQPLVQWEDSDDSEEDIINFFPLSRKESKSHQEISDTFSIEELSISGDDDEEEDLHLVPPSTIYRTVTCCPHSCTLL